jgi:hypothetical protein
MPCRAIRALKTGVNYFEVSRFNSLTRANESRIEKYKTRGFGTSVMNKDLLLETGGLEGKEKERVQHHNIKSLARSIFIGKEGGKKGMSGGVEMK